MTKRLNQQDLKLSSMNSRPAFKHALNTPKENIEIAHFQKKQIQPWDLKNSKCLKEKKTPKF